MGHNRSYVNSVWMSQTNTRDALRQTATSWTPEVRVGVCTCSQQLLRKSDSSYFRHVDTYLMHSGLPHLARLQCVINFKVSLEGFKSLKEQIDILGQNLLGKYVIFPLNIKLQPAGSLAKRLWLSQLSIKLARLFQKVAKSTYQHPYS